VEAKGTVRVRPRNIVARLKLEELPESVPQAGVVAGGINVSNNGNKLMIEATGTQVLVRCTPAPGDGGACTSYQSGQITPVPQSAGASQPPFLTPAQLERFKQRAITDGRYFPAGTCPTTAAQLTGQVVFVEACNSHFANSIGPFVTCAVPPGMSPNCINTADDPGLLIWHCGLMDWQGGMTFNGVVYHANNSDGLCPPAYPAKGGNCNNSANAAVVSNGGWGVNGALVIDGAGCLEVGSNGLQIKFDGNAFNAVTSYGTVGLVQNTWRELKSGS
jgi:hypothetical protein